MFLRCWARGLCLQSTWAEFLQTKQPQAVQLLPMELFWHKRQKTVASCKQQLLCYQRFCLAEQYIGAAALLSSCSCHRPYMALHQASGDGWTSWRNALHSPHSPTLLARSYNALPLHKIIGTGPDSKLCCSNTRCSCGSCPRYVGSSPVSWLCSSISHCSCFSLLMLSGKGPLHQTNYMKGCE